ncbi:hypothetical protein IU469_37300, partial [Nocardia puris]
AVKDDTVGIERLRELTSELQQLFYGLDTAAGGTAGNQAGGGARRDGGGDDVIDAEFTSE